MKSLKYIFIIIIFVINYESIHSQIIFEKKKHDFGAVSSISDRFVDIKVTNKSAKKEFLLSVKKPPNVVYLVNGQFIEKDSSLTIRLQVNPKLKGRFSYDVQIYTSDKDEPTIVQLIGNLTEEITNQTNFLQACPDFNTHPTSKNATDFELTILTIDKKTRLPLSESTVTFIQNGIAKGRFNTSKQGEIKQKTPLGFIYLYASHPNYISKEMGAYVNFQRNKLIIELEQNAVITSQPIVNEQPKQNIENKIDKNIESTLKKELEKEIIVEKEIKKEEAIVNIKFNDLDPSLFDETHFKPINVTFVLDVSASMQAGEKMELMKYSLYQITEMLRKQDKISIVTYSTETKVELPTTTGVEKEKIKSIVENLKAGGLTAGGSGIKLGYKQTLDVYIPEGTNQIVIITDGAFNRNSDDYKSHIEKYKKKGINMTVVGILNSEIDRKAMEKVAEIGGGRYISIQKLSDAMNNLKQELRYISFIGH